MDMDYVVMAVGGKVEKEVLENSNIEMSKKKYIAINGNNQTSCEKVFAAGDVAGTESTVAWAARDGRSVAEKIAQYLEKE